MSKASDTGTTAIDRTRPSAGQTAGYRWTCPFCGTTRRFEVDGDQPAWHATAALRSHVIASDGGGHGARGRFPDDVGLAIMTLDEHVVRLDD